MTVDKEKQTTNMSLAPHVLHDTNRAYQEAGYWI